MPSGRPSATGPSWLRNAPSGQMSAGEVEADDRGRGEQGRDVLAVRVLEHAGEAFLRCAGARQPDHPRATRAEDADGLTPLVDDELVEPVVTGIQVVRPPLITLARTDVPDGGEHGDDIGLEPVEHRRPAVAPVLAGLRGPAQRHAEPATARDAAVEPRHVHDAHTVRRSPALEPSAQGLRDRVTDQQDPLHRGRWRRERCRRGGLGRGRGSRRRRRGRAAVRRGSGQRQGGDDVLGVGARKRRGRRPDG